MKRSVLVLSLLILAALVVAPALAQAGGAAPSYSLIDARRDLRRLDLDEDGIAAIRAILEKDALELEKARAAIRQAQATLARQMLEEKPDRVAMAKTVRESVEAEYAQRLIQIERNLALKEILGTDRWLALSRLTRNLALFERLGDLRDAADRGADPERLRALYRALKALQ